MKAVVKLILIATVFTLSGCSEQELRTFNKAMHDSTVQMNRERQQKIDKCHDDYYRGYRDNLNCGY